MQVKFVQLDSPCRYQHAMACRCLCTMTGDRDSCGARWIHPLSSLASNTNAAYHYRGAFTVCCVFTHIPGPTRHGISLNAMWGYVGPSYVGLSFFGRQDCTHERMGSGIRRDAQQGQGVTEYPLQCLSGTRTELRAGVHIRYR
jgi:hypothetical protein